ncbi:hypothetical protein [Niallia sp. Krafla_26]|uniref:hypothetical protein n=1 Tax=Niallia sp. Krafla_26 TaxID=3064703 RepID=UPI003D1850AF
MRKLTVLILTVVLFLLLSACSSKEVDQAIDKGMDMLAEKNYASAVSYFEMALAEDEADPKTKSYLEQANLLKQAVQSMEDEDYDAALATIIEIEKMGETLSMVKTDASDLKKEISEKKQESVYQNELNTIQNLIESGHYDEAQGKLTALKEQLGDDSTYQSKLVALTEEIQEQKGSDTALEKETENKQEVAKGEKADEPKKKQKEAAAFKTYNNARFGFSVEYPTSFTMGEPPTNDDGRSFTNGEFTMVAYGSHINTVEDNETIEDYYHRALASSPSPIAYQRLGDNWYIVSYIDGFNIHYEKAMINNDVIYTLQMKYPTGQKDKYDKIVTRISNSFKAGR